MIFFPIFLFSGFQKNKTKIGIHYDFVHANQNKTKTTQRTTEPQNTSLASHSNCLNAINRYVDARKVSICSLLLICRTKKHFGISLTIFWPSSSLLFLLLLIFTSNLSTMPPRALMPYLDRFPTIYDANMYCSLNIFERTFKSTFFVLSESCLLLLQQQYTNLLCIWNSQTTLPCFCLSFHRLNRCCLVSLRFLRLFFWLAFVSRSVATILTKDFSALLTLFFC